MNEKWFNSLKEKTEKILVWSDKVGTLNSIPQVDDLTSRDIIKFNASVLYTDIRDSSSYKARHQGHQHYADWSATSYLGVMAHLSRWLDQHQWLAANLTPLHIEEFVIERRRQGYAKGRSTRGMVGVLVAYLREIGAIPTINTHGLRTPRDRVVEAFGAYLADQRGLAPRTIHWYRSVATHFLASINIQRTDLDFALTVTGIQVYQFLQEKVGSRGTGSFHNITVAVRSLLRFLFIAGWIPQPMAGTVLPAPGWRDSKPLRDNPSTSQVTDLLDTCDRSSPAGCRDFAILLLLSRLGLRGEK